MIARNYSIVQMVLAKTMTSLLNTNPALAKDWHPTKNALLTPADVTPGSHKKAWWICGKGHEWEAQICDRNRGTGCPYCSGRLATKGKNLLINNPRYADAYYNRSVAYISMGQYDRAIADCNKVLQLDPSHANSYYSRGVSYWHLGSKSQAIKDFQAAAKLKHKGAQDFLLSKGTKW